MINTNRESKQNIAGLLLICARILIGNAILIDISRIQGKNLNYRNLDSFWKRVNLDLETHITLTIAGKRIIENASHNLRQKFRSEAGVKSNTEVFKRIRTCASFANNPRYPVGSSDLSVAKQTLMLFLDQYLQGQKTIPIDFAKSYIIEFTTEELLKELINEMDVWQDYHLWILRQLLAHKSSLRNTVISTDIFINHLTDTQKTYDSLNSARSILQSLYLDLKEDITQQPHHRSEFLPNNPSQKATHLTTENNTTTTDHILKFPNKTNIKRFMIENQTKRTNILSIQSEHVINLQQRAINELLISNLSDQLTKFSYQESFHMDRLYCKITFSFDHLNTHLSWKSYAFGVRTSRLIPPYQGADLALVLRALDALQYPNYPTPTTQAERLAFAFSPQEQARLAALGLWDTGLPGDAHRRVGRRLHAALTADPAAAQALRTARDHATANGQRLALALRFPPEAVGLAALPWELLWDDEPLPLLLSRGLADCTRHLDLAQALPPARPRQGPLRILALAPQAGIDPATRAAERAARQAAWQPLTEQGLVLVREVGPATRGAIIDAIHQHQPDIIHYYGHGRYQNGTGALLLDAPGGGANWTDVPRLMALFGAARLVALFACQGAMLDGDAGLLSAVAPALSAAGVPLVIGMQLTARVDAATRASALIYQTLAAGLSVQEAVGRARQALYVEEEDQASWYLPALYIRSRETGPALV